MFQNIKNLIPYSEKNIVGVDVPFILIGKKEYQLLPWLIKEYPTTKLSPEKETFNKCVKAANIVTEKAFKRFKEPYRMLSDYYTDTITELADYQFMPKVFIACCAISNLVVDDRWGRVTPELVPYLIPSETKKVTGSEIREALCELLTKRKTKKK